MVELNTIGSTFMRNRTFAIMLLSMTFCTTLSAQQQEPSMADMKKTFLKECAKPVADMTVIEDMISKHPKIIDKGDRYGRTCFWFSVQQGDMELFSYLIENPKANPTVDIDAYDNVQSLTPLMLAIILYETPGQNDYQQMAKTLIERKADLNMTDIKGNNPLMLAVTHGNIEMTKMILEKEGKNRVNLEAKNDRKRTAMDLATLGIKEATEKNNADNIKLYTEISELIKAEMAVEAKE